MRFDVPFVFIVGAASAAGIPRANRAGWAVDRQSGGRLQEAEKEIEQLDEKLQHDLEELEHKQHQHHRPGPYWHPSRPYGYQHSSDADSAIPATPAASASNILTSSVSSFSSAANTTAALHSLSSVAASLSSVLSSVSSVNATVTLATTVPFANASYTDIPNSTLALPTDVASNSAVSSSTDTCTDSVSTGPADGASATSVYTYTSSSIVYFTTTVFVTTPVSVSTGSAESVSTSPVDTYIGSSTVYTTITVTASSSSSAASTGSEESAVTTSVATYYTGGSTIFSTTTVAVSVSSGLAESSSVVDSASSPAAYPSVSSVAYPYGNSSSAYFPTGTGVSQPVVTANTTSALPIGTATSTFNAGNSTSAFATGTSSRVSMAPTPSAVANVSAAANTTSAIYCQNLCSSLALDTEYNTIPISCEAIPANTEYTFTGGQATAGCGSTSTTSFTPEVDICRVTLSVTTSGESETYMEVWLPNNGTEAWNGRTLSTDNGGANGCVHYVDMQYVTGLGFAAIGDNGGHNSSAFDAGWMYFQNEVILDWVYRARHASVEAGKQVISQFYDEKPTYSYYVGCSTGGQQGMYSAQHYPNDFDGIIAGSSAADMNHLQGWSGRFVQLTGANSSDARFLTLDQWILVQSYIFDQCDEALDGVNDGIIEDPTICEFDASAIPVCGDVANSTCLSSTQINTVEQVFTELYNEDGELLYPALLYGSQVDAFRLGQLSGSLQAISSKWYGGAVHNDSNYNALNMDQADYALADSLDALHGDVSSFNGDLSGFEAAGGKLLMYHGLADPLVSGGNSQRYYLKVAKTLGTDNTGLDPFFRLFRISGMAHCGVGGIAGAGAWMFGQNAAAAVEGVKDNIIWNMVDWVESNDAPDTITGTKFNYDTPSLGVQFTRNHCRFPYRTTYSGSGDSNDPANWGCDLISDWQTCGVGAHPRLCNADGTFT